MFKLALGHLQHLLIVEYVHVGLGDVHAYVVLGLLQVLDCGFEAELAELDAVVDVETLENRDVGTEGERR